MKKENLDVMAMENGKQVKIGVVENVNIPETLEDITENFDTSYIVSKFNYGHKVALRAAFKSSLKPASIGISNDTKKMIKDGIKSGQFTEADLNAFIASRSV